MERHPDWQRLARYFAAECSEAEEEELLAWAATDPSRRELLDDTRRVWEVAGEEGWDASAAWDRIERRLAEAPPPSAVAPASRAPVARTPAGAVAPPWRWAIAACLSGVVVAGLLWWMSPLVGSGPEPARVAAQELITDKGERARIRLSDGSQVLLAPGSRVEVPANFGVSGREIRLSGEAYFDVASDPTRPFLVHAGGAVTRVLGTEFNIRAYPDDPGVRVVVAEGEVSLRAEPDGSSASAVLRPGELGELRPGGADVATRKADLDLHLGWRQGRLTFDDTPLTEVVREIERWYGVPVRLGDDAISSRRLTASFRDQAVDEVIAVIAASLGLEYTRVGQTYLLVLKGNAAALAAR